MIDFDAAGNAIGMEVFDVHARKDTVQAEATKLRFVDGSSSVTRAGLLPRLARLLKARTTT
jgi:hypothetical protein